METGKQRILFVTDLYCKASQRTYYTEGLFLTSQLRKDFDLIICHPKDTCDFFTIYNLYKKVASVISRQFVFERIKIEQLFFQG